MISYIMILNDQVVSEQDGSGDQDNSGRVRNIGLVTNKADKSQVAVGVYRENKVNGRLVPMPVRLEASKNALERGNKVRKYVIYNNIIV
jgi:hypothetical protein